MSMALTQQAVDCWESVGVTAWRPRKYVSGAGDQPKTAEITGN